MLVNYWLVEVMGVGMRDCGCRHSIAAFIGAAAHMAVSLHLQQLACLGMLSAHFLKFGRSEHWWRQSAWSSV